MGGVLAGLSLLPFFLSPRDWRTARRSRRSPGPLEGNQRVAWALMLPRCQRDVYFATHLHGRGDPAAAGGFVLGVEAGRVAGLGAAPGLGSGPSATRENLKGARPLAG